MARRDVHRIAHLKQNAETRDPRPRSRQAGRMVPYPYSTTPVLHEYSGSTLAVGNPKGHCATSTALEWARRASRTGTPPPTRPGLAPYLHHTIWRFLISGALGDLPSFETQAGLHDRQSSASVCVCVCVNVRRTIYRVSGLHQPRRR